MSMNELVDDFCRSLRRRHVEGSLATGKRTAELLRILITSQRHADAQSLLDDVRRVGVRIQSAKPLGESHSSSHQHLPLESHARMHESPARCLLGLCMHVRICPR